jgi:hypothetical protein
MKQQSTISSASTINRATSPGPTNVLYSVSLRKSKILVQAMSKIIAIEQHGMMAAQVEPLLHRLAIVEFPDPDRPVNHKMQGFWDFARLRSVFTIVKD